MFNLVIKDSAAIDIGESGRSEFQYYNTRLRLGYSIIQVIIDYLFSSVPT
jgi:hypothetical protein